MTESIITTPPERRQIARVLTFTPEIAKFVDWPSIASDARELGAHFEARNTDDGSWVITFFWTYADAEAHT